MRLYRDNDRVFVVVFYLISVGRNILIVFLLLLCLLSVLLEVFFTPKSNRSSMCLFAQGFYDWDIKRCRKTIFVRNLRIFGPVRS